MTDATSTAVGAEREIPREAVLRARPWIRRMLIGASATVLLEGVSMGLGFATSVLLARWLGSQEYGEYAFALAWAGTLGTVAILGMDRFLVRGLGVYHVRNEWALMRGLLKRTTQLGLLISIAVGLVGCIVAVSTLSAGVRLPFALAMIFVPLSTLTLLRQGAMQAFGRVVAGQLPEYVIRPAIILGLIVALAVLGSGALSSATAVGANLTGMGVACVVGLLLLRRTVPGAVASVNAKYSTRAWVVSSVPMMLISSVWALNNYAATLIVGSLDGARDAGIYNVVEKSAGLIAVFLVAANMPLAPTVARLFAQGDHDALQHTVARTAQVTFVVALPVALAFLIFPGDYLRIFGVGFIVGGTGADDPNRGAACERGGGTCRDCPDDDWP